jgi:hypothetical protein
MESMAYLYVPAIEVTLSQYLLRWAFIEASGNNYKEVNGETLSPVIWYFVYGNDNHGAINFNSSWKFFECAEAEIIIAG